MTITEDVPAQRAPRSDRGSRRMLPRDLHALEWLWDMRAISEPDLAVLLGMIGNREPLSDGGVRSVLDRWRAMGLVHAARPLVGQPRAVWLTPAGGEWIGRPRVTAPAPSRLAHTCAVARARLLLESEGGSVEWTSEREILADMAGRRTREHVPDARAVINGNRTAVEVELTRKPIRDIARIMGELGTSSRHDAVIYLCGSEALAGAARQARELAAEEAARAAARMPLDPRAHVEPTRAQIDRMRARLVKIVVRVLPDDLRAELAE